MSRSVSGVDEVVRAVRETVQDGADCIKLMTAHAWGPLPDEPSSWATYFTEEELHAAVTTAHGFGVPVAAHCHGETALRSVINAGVDSIEHGSGLTRELAKLMAANGTFLVPTLASYDNISARGEAGGLTGGRIEQAKWVRNRQREGLTLAMEEGVAIAAGSDAGFHMLPHGESLIRELELYAELGMTPLDVLRTATSNAARLVGVADQLGSLAVGKKADFIVSEADPLLDLSNLRQLSLVSLGGVTYEPRTLRKPLMSPGARLREGRRTHVANELQNAVR
jgi:imidazolonepropionase-like amidohydrolase